jgi:peptide chain release factor 3
MPPETESTGRNSLEQEVARRRTFAIISHPDAGKTTLTEKICLYAGAVNLAGAVRTRSGQQSTASDFMTMEKQRGISVSATALEMEYKGFHINLLDTPGHQDFSEDTYRTLMAVDSAVMVLDSAKGVEPQTEKLFKVCRLRGIPILTFINKMDHAGRDPLELLDEVERVLGIAAVPVNWPVGEGPTFQGVYDLRSRRILRFQKTVHNQHRAPVDVTGLDDPRLPELLGTSAARKLADDIELLEGTVGTFDTQAFLEEKMTPVFFGSALNNFGVEPFLDAVLELAPAPAPRTTEQGVIDPSGSVFSGFIFKVQANLDPRHRDRMAFLRVCSGKFEKDMTVRHPRLGRDIRLSRAFRIFGREREPIDEAYPGDVIGVISPGLFTIGDSVTTGDVAPFAAIPRFAPENFASLENTDISRYKQFHTGLEQLEEEGAVQVFHGLGGSRTEPILAAVGELQFDVVLSRLAEEYGVKARLTSLPYTCCRWVQATEKQITDMYLSRSNRRCTDRLGRTVILFSSIWDIEFIQKKNPDLTFTEIA